MYKENLPNNLRSLAINSDFLRSKFGIDGFNIGLDEGSRIGRHYLKEEYYSKFEGKSFPFTDDQKVRLELSEKVLEEGNLGMLLIRPEMYHLQDKVKGFLNNNKFTVVYETDKKVSSGQYWSMYRDVFYREKAVESLPTRTMVYTGGVSRLIVFKSVEEIDESLPDLFCREYKGKEGIDGDNTIRGEVVLREALRLGFDNLGDTRIAKALDPIYVLRNIVEESDVDKPHSHLPKERYLLKYNAVSVHVPDGSEIARDLAVLNDVNSLGEIHEKLVSINIKK